MKLIARMVFPCLLASVAWAAPAIAADYDPPLVIDAPEDVDEFVPVEVGTGWYLRGDVGYAINKPFAHRYSSYTSPVGTPGEYRDNASLLTGSIGMGYQFNSYLRSELNLSMLPTNESSSSVVGRCEGTGLRAVGDTVIEYPDETAPCDVSNSARNKAYAVSAAGFVDLGTFAGFTPYVGAGMGLTYTKSQRTVNEKHCVDTPTFRCDDVLDYRGVRDSVGGFNFNYSLAAGVAYQLSQNLKLDVGYEFMSTPTAKWVSYDSDQTFRWHKGLDYHQVKVGLRYALW